MFCKGGEFYRQYLKRLVHDPVGALHMLRAHKQKRVDGIDRALARHGFVRDQARTVGKERRN